MRHPLSPIDRQATYVSCTSPQFFLDMFLANTMLGMSVWRTEDIQIGSDAQTQKQAHKCSQEFWGTSDGFRFS
jgi:hypothetical protein